MHHYHRKQFTIVFVFILITVVVIGGAWILIKPPKSTCFDGIQNQGEKGVDCGGPCGLCPEDIREDLNILLEDFILTIDDNYDLVAEIENPNRQWGVESITYRFNLYNKNDELIGFKEGTSYILPQETKYIIEQKFSSITPVASMIFEIRNINWWKLKDFDELELKIKDEQHNLVDEKFHQLSGNVENRSGYDLNIVQIIGVIFGDNNEIIAAGKTEVNSLLSGEVRYFEINWPYESDRVISGFELRPYTNVFLDENFIKKYGTPEKFKEY